MGGQRSGVAVPHRGQPLVDAPAADDLAEPRCGPDSLRRAVPHGDYTVKRSKHATLVANTADTVIFSSRPKSVALENLSTTAVIFYRLDGTSPTVARDDTYALTRKKRWKLIFLETWNRPGWTSSHPNLPGALIIATGPFWGSGPEGAGLSWNTMKGIRDAIKSAATAASIPSIDLDEMRIGSSAAPASGTFSAGTSANARLS